MPVEVRNREQGLGLGGKHGLLLAEVFDAHRENRFTRRAGFAESSDVRLGERPLPGERPAGDEPRAVTVTMSFADLREVHGHPSRLSRLTIAGHGTAVPCAASGDSLA